jgi:hypothetical protein
LAGLEVATYGRFSGGHRGHWLIYKNPDTARWHTRAEAVRIIEARMGLSKAASDETLASQDGLG